MKRNIIIGIVLLVYAPVALYLSYSSPFSPYGGFTDISLQISDDAREYTKLADSIIEERVFSLNGESSHAFRTPGYPVLLALVKMVSGSFDWIILLQVAAACATAYLVMCMAERFMPQKYSYIAGIIYLLDPTVILHAFMVLSDITFNLLFVGALYIIFFRTVTRRSLALSGLMLGYGALIRPIALYTLPVIILGYLLYSKGFKLKKIWLNVAVLCTAVSLVVVPWMYRNYKSGGEFTLSSISAFNMFYFNLPEYISVKSGEGVQQVRARMIGESGVYDLEDMRDLRNSDKLNAVSGEILKNEFFGYGLFHAVKTIPFFFSSGLETAVTSYNSAVENEYRYALKDSNISNALYKADLRGVWDALKASPFFIAEYFILGLMTVLSGLALLRKDNRLMAAILLALILCLATLTGPVSYSRYRLPATPFISVLSLVGLYVIMERLKSYR